MKGMDEKEIYEKYQKLKKKNVKEANEYIFPYLEKLVGLTINRYFWGYKSLYMEDLLQCGYEAILKNLDKYDPDKGSFSTFFVICIRENLQNFIYNYHYNFSIYYHRNMMKIEEFVDGYKVLYNRMPSIKIIANACSLSEEAVKEATKLQENEKQIFHHMVSIKDASYNDSYEGQNLLEEVIKKDQSVDVANALLSLEIEEQIIVTKRLSGLNMKKTSMETGISYDSVRNKFRSAKTKLREYLSECESNFA